MADLSLIEQCRQVKLIPVLVIENAEDALPIASALHSAGLSVIEVTLRSSAAWNAVEKIRDHVDGVTIGVGSVLQKSQLLQANSMGLDFAVSPGYTPELLATAKDIDMHYLPGVATISEIMAVRDQGYRFMKFFPAQLSGGVAALQAFSGPVQDVKFCPTGGISPQNLQNYLQCPNVVCAGGSWLVSTTDQHNRDWQNIKEKALQAAELIGIARV